VDSSGQTIDFLLTAKRDTAAAKLFFEKVFSSSSNPIPRVINVDKNPAYPAAVEALKAEGTLPRRVHLRQCKYLNKVIEQDHRTVKKRDLVGKRLRLLSKCLANSPRHRNDEHDPQGPSPMGSKGRCRCRSTVHRQALRYRCLTSPSPSQLSCVRSKLRNETAFRPQRAVRTKPKKAFYFSSATFGRSSPSTYFELPP
jgi:DDE domain